MNTTATLERRVDTWPQRLSDWFDMPDLTRWFDRVGRFEDFIRIEETVADGTLVVKAELPGIDPERDVDISVAEGVLTIHAERHEERRDEQVGGSPGRTRSEFRYGSFSRSLAVPKSVKTGDITATYHDGILTVTVPMPEEKHTAVTKIPVARA
jgi:HSP20 family protein